MFPARGARPLPSPAEDVKEQVSERGRRWSWTGGGTPPSGMGREETKKDDLTTIMHLL